MSYLAGDMRHRKKSKVFKHKDVIHNTEVNNEPKAINLP